MSLLIVNALALAVYVLVALLYVRAARHPDEPTAPANARWFAAVGAGLHGASVLGSLVWGGMFGFAESLSAVAFALMIVLLVLGRSRERLGTLGVFLAPTAAGLLAASFAAPSATVAALDTVETGWWLPVHLGLVFAAFAGFFLEFFVSTMQYVVRRRLKDKKLAGLTRLPSLQVLDRVQYRSLLFGLACLGLGILSGAVWASSTMHHESWAADAKVWVTAVVWVWYAAVLQARSRLGWHGRWSMALSAVGFAGLIFSWVGLEFLTGGFHAYGG